MIQNSVIITRPGQEAETTTLGELGVRLPFKVTFASGAPDEAELQIPGSAVADTLPYRTRVLVKLDGINFFHGIVAAEPNREKSGNSKGITLLLAGPWFWLNAIYEAQFTYVSSYTDNDPGQPVSTTVPTTHFTLNRDANGFLLRSRDQIVAILDYLIAAGAYIAYDAADIADLPVLPVDVHNVTCDEAIRKQFENYNVVMGFDHTQDPPKFYARQAATMAKKTLTFKAQPEATAPTGLSLTRQSECEVPGVKITFEQTSNGYPVYTDDIYPPGFTDKFFPLVTTVPLRGYSSNTQEVTLTIQAVDITNVDWWKARIPKLKNEKEYDRLRVVFGSATRDYPDLPRFIVPPASVPDWLAGTVAMDRVRVKLSWQKPQGTGVADIVTEKEFSLDIYATDLPEVTKKKFTYTNVTDAGENPADFVGMAEQIYNDLHRPKYAGSIPVLETKYSGEIVLGKLYNVAGVNTLTEWNTMDAIAQQLAVVVYPGSVEYNLRVGPNPWLNADTLTERLRAIRQSYFTMAFIVGSAQRGASIRLPAKAADTTNDEVEPTHSQKTVFVQDAGKNYGVTLAANPQQQFYPTAPVAVNPTFHLGPRHTNGEIAEGFGQCFLQHFDLGQEDVRFRWLVACWDGQYYRFKVPIGLLHPISKGEADDIMSALI